MFNVIILGSALATGVLFQSPKTIAATDAKAHLNETVTACGTVASTRYDETVKNKPTFLNFEKPFPDQVLTAVIFGVNREAFGEAPEKRYRDTRICVTGTIEEAPGVPNAVRIVVVKPSQIVVKEEAKPKGKH